MSSENIQHIHEHHDDSSGVDLDENNKNESNQRDEQHYRFDRDKTDELFYDETMDDLFADTWHNDYAHSTTPLPEEQQAVSQGLAVAAQRHIGRVRHINQDNIYSFVTTIPRGDTDLTAGLFIVADGMGGHQHGEIASRMTICAIVEYVFSSLLFPLMNDDIAEPIQTVMVKAVERANTEIWNYAQHMNTDMGSTCTAVLLMGKTVYVAHVGDTRAYVLEHGAMRLLTTDHSAVGRLIQLGQLAPSAAREHPLRNQIYRAIGQYPSVEVDLIYETIDHASHILVCSDGLWGLITDDMLASVIQTHPIPYNTCQQLIAMANDNGGDDNIAAIVVALPIDD